MTFQTQLASFDFGAAVFFILSSRQTLHVCSEIVSSCFVVLLSIVLVKPVYSPKAACVRPDRFRQSGPLTIPLLPNSFADPVRSPNVTCVRANRFRSLKPSLLCFFTFRETLRVCSQRFSGGRFARRLPRAFLFLLIECHQTQHA